MVKDTIGDFIIQLKNAATSGKETVTAPFSNLKNAIADVLEQEGFVKNLTKKGKKGLRYVELSLVQQNGPVRLRGVERISKPSKRIYGSTSDIRPVKSGYGFTIISTSKGIMTDRTAKKEGLGGELLFKIW